MKEEKVVDKEWVKDRISVIYLPLLLQLVLLVFFFMGINYLLSNKETVFLLCIVLFFIPIIVLVHCYYAFKSFGQLSKKNYVSFFSMLGLLINVLLVILNVYIIYLLVLNLL